MNPSPKQNQIFWTKGKLITVTVILAISLVIGLFGRQIARYLPASLVGLQPPFDGAIMPLAKTANWVALTSDDYTKFKSGEYTYSNFPTSKLMNLPTYDPALLCNTDPSKLGWTGNDLNIRNVFLTYVTAYLGTYTSGTQSACEGKGSHIGVDIRAPKGTPVMAMAAGIVEKTKDSDGTVCIHHYNVPEYNELVSCYLHLDTIGVQLNDVVTKGQEIGTVGKKGIASTHHLHFQIDTISAPYHSYWPFTWSEASAAGLDFTTAVDAGLGLENGKKYTISPLTFIQQHASADSSTTTTTNNSTTTTSSNTSTTTSNNNSSNNTTNATTNYRFVIEGNTSNTVGSTVRLTLKVYTGDSLATSWQPTTPVRLTAQGAGSLSLTSLNSFNAGSAIFQYTSNAAENAIITATDGTASASLTVNFVDHANPVSSFRVTPQSRNFKENETVVFDIETLDSNGQVTPNLFPGQANLTVLDNQDKPLSVSGLTSTTVDGSVFTQGQWQVMFRPTFTQDFVLEIRNGALSGRSPAVLYNGTNGNNHNAASSTGDRPFPDVGLDHPNYQAIKYLKDKNMIDGYPDGNFGPDDQINRVQAVKMLLKGFNIDGCTTDIDLSFPDLSDTAWYAKYVCKAVNEQYVKGYPDGTFGPEKNILRAELAKIVMNIAKITPVTNVSDMYLDVTTDDWYYSYAATAKTLNLFDLSNKYYFAGQDNMSRGQVAETIYRVLRLKELGWSTYDRAADGR